MDSGDYWATTKKVPGSLHPHPDFMALAAGGARILDLGCGQGRILAKMGGGAGVRCGVDRNAGALARAAREIPQALFACADILCLPFADKTFDAACMQAVMTLFEHRQARLSALAEVRRVTRSRLFIADFLLTPENEYYAKRYAKGLEETGEYGTFLVREGNAILYTAHHYSREELAGLLGETGFVVESFDEARAVTRSGNVINGAQILARPV